jgi:ABC-2 type transport system permease protein
MSAYRNGWGVMQTLVKREFLEHRLLFVYTPLLCVLMCVMLFAITLVQSDLPEADPAAYSDVVTRDGTAFTAQRQIDGFNMGVRSRFVRNLLNDFERLLRLALWLSLIFYFLTTLYQQRKDRSILFWNSLPVADSQTILSKLLAGLVLCHAFYLVGMAALELLLPGVVWIYSEILGTQLWDSYLDTALEASLTRNFALFHMRELIVQMPIDVLWTLPVCGWLLLVSARSRRAPVLWALAPWLFVIFIELALADRSWLLDSVIAHAIAVDDVTIIPARVQSQLLPGALLGVLFIYAAIRFNRADDS